MLYVEMGVEVSGKILVFLIYSTIRHSWYAIFRSFLHVFVLDDMEYSISFDLVYLYIAMKLMNTRPYFLV